MRSNEKSNMDDNQVMRENVPIFVPPRKRASRSSTENVPNKCSPRTNIEIHSDCQKTTYQKLSLKAVSKSDESDLSDSAHLNDERSALNSSNGSFVTMTGTVKRGRQKGQTLDMKVQMSREELDELEHTILSEKDEQCLCGLRKGLHIFLWSVLLVPAVLLLSAGYSFYMGTMTWYNILIYLSEKKSIFHKILMSPLLIISYPFLISLSTVGLGVYSAIVQISWYLDNWKGEFQDFEKGFYGWLCGVMNLEECAPYEVVILTEVSERKQQFADTAL